MIFGGIVVKPKLTGSSCPHTVKDVDRLIYWLGGGEGGQKALLHHTTHENILVSHQ